MLRLNITSMIQLCFADTRKYLEFEREISIRQTNKYQM